MSATHSKDIDQIFEEGTLIDRALRQAVREALREHKRAGNPIVVWRNGRVVWVPAKEIKVPGDRPRRGKKARTRTSK